MFNDLSHIIFINIIIVMIIVIVMYLVQMYCLFKKIIINKDCNLMKKKIFPLITPTHSVTSSPAC